MCKELEADLGVGREAAAVLVENMMNMGAGKCTIPVTVDGREFEVIAQAKAATSDKPKMGMYDETPKIQIGKLTICDAQLPTNGKLWIDDDEHDAGEFPKDKVYEVLKAYYDKNF